MTGPVEVRPGAFTVPQNRWDLLPAPTSAPRTSVVVAYFEQQENLPRLLAGLAAQVGAVDIAEVVVADDGSAQAPVIPAWYAASEVVVVRQDDLGVRPAAARNLGADAATGDVLVFLDGDMVPGPGFVAAMASLPAVAPEAVVVGTREHHDLTGWGAEEIRRWFEGGSPPPRLDDPAWLAQGYERTRHLVDLDARSYQWFIGAVMATSVELFGELGGFDATIDVYGGEDWELAHRAQQAGAILAHVDAVAHHDGPEWRARVGPSGTKNPERLHVARTIPGRHDAIIGRQPLATVTLDGAGVDADRVVACAASILADGGTAVSIVVDHPPAGVAAAVRHDPRVRLGPVGPDATAAPVVVDPAVVDVVALAPVRLEVGAVDGLLDAVAPGGPGRVVVVDEDGPLLHLASVRAGRRSARWANDEIGAEGWNERLFGAIVHLPARRLGVHRLHGPIDLAEVLPR